MIRCEVCANKNVLKTQQPCASCDTLTIINLESRIEKLEEANKRKDKRIAELEAKLEEEMAVNNESANMAARIAELEAAIKRLNKETDRMRNELENVVNELELSEYAIEKYGPDGTPPYIMVRDVLREKDLRIRALKSGMIEIDLPPLPERSES